MTCCVTTTQLANRFPGLAVNKVYDLLLGGRGEICAVFVVMTFSIQNNLSNLSLLLNGKYASEKTDLMLGFPMAQSSVLFKLESQILRLIPPSCLDS